MATPLDQTEQNEQMPDTESPAEDTQEQAAPEEGNVSSQDVEIAVRLGIKMLSQGNGLKVIADALNKSKDPGQVVGQFLAQLMGKLAEQLKAKLNVDPKVFLAKRGFLEQILDYIEVKLGLPKDFSDQVYNEVLNAVKAAAMGPPPPNSVMGGKQAMPLDQAGGM